MIYIFKKLYKKKLLVNTTETLLIKIIYIFRKIMSITFCTNVEDKI